MSAREMKLQDQKYKSQTVPAQTEDKQYIGDYHTAPEFMKDNDNITHGYRINFNTPRKIFRSLFMVHNESVNIWSHCIPAIFIIFFLTTFYVMVDSEAMRKSFNQYHQQLNKGMNHYMHALDNISLIAEYDKFSKKTQSDLSELKQTVMINYEEFVKKIQESTHKIQTTFQTEVKDVQSNIKDILKQNMAQFQRAKRQFQLKIAPLLIEEVNEKLNSTWIKSLKDKVEELKKEIDSDYFQVLELHEHLPNPQQISRWPIMVFLITAIVCLLCSTIFHLFYPMSSKIYTITNRFDYAGINLLISGSAFPPFYYGMYCQLDVAIIYLTCTIIFAIVCFVICLFEWIHRPEHKKYKGWLYATFGGSLSIPLSHILINELIFDNYGDPFEFSSSFVYYVLLAASYFIGLYIYVQQCPERNRPGRYNTCGHSHQIWHGFVVLGIFFTYLGALENFEMRKISVCPA